MVAGVRVLWMDTMSKRYHHWLNRLLTSLLIKCQIGSTILNLLMTATGGPLVIEHVFFLGQAQLGPSIGFTVTGL